MPSYRVTNRVTGETQEVEAPFAQTACELLDWLIGNCHVEPLKESPFNGYANRRQHISPENEARLEAQAKLRALQPASAAEAKGWL